MASEWVKLTEYTVGEIHVNLALATSIQRVGKEEFTTVWFSPDHPKGIVKVTEEPEVILAKLHRIGNA